MPHLRTILLALLLYLGATTPVAGQDLLRILSWPGYVSKDAISAFEQRHQVKVQVQEVTSDDALWSLANAANGGNFDLIAVNTAELARYIEADLLAPIRTANIPNTRRQTARFRHPQSIPGLVRSGEVFGIPYTYSAMGLIYNRKLITIPPTSLNALWDPRYKGKVLAYEGSTHNFSLAALSLGYHRPFNLQPEQFGKVVKRLKALRENVAKFYATPEEVVQAFREQEIALVFANYGDQQIQLLLKAGMDIGYVIPSEGALAWLDCWAVMRRAGNRALAEAWINHTLSKDVSSSLTLREGLANTLKDSPRPAMPDTGKLIWLEPVENSALRSSYWERIVTLPPRGH
ncbi:extracellular solute-binding protein [Uliginosibacterium sp. TH139]|uniref:extracellular solute-binding protein n=1 Tax=Uliginosibacterium sp. TH139 TaxID=2067453 RepID=UPI000C7AA83D|nr:extracellular solute-binding protein [Uliginosibacterium sp. TH139]PLK49913.1 spermidine/putrescine ABC transporter substrate-binding protein [Uliginosibacterium sp. TH139]